MIDAQGNAHDGAGQFTEKSNSDPEVELPGRPQAYVVATSATDDAAYESLADLSTLLEGREETVVIGGHMVSLICTAFPSSGLVERRTGDADAGIPVELAATGEMHEGLLALGYVAEGANRYVKGGEDPKPTIDLLVPSLTDKFGDEKKGGRAFNTMPGLSLAMNPRIPLDVHITHRDGRERSLTAMVPGIEAAIVMKAFAWRDRHHQTDKDGVDLSNLFAVLAEHGPDELGGWRLDESDLRANRRYAAAHLHQLADLWEVKPPKAAINVRALVSRIRTHVTRP
ncbi:hypothetical protein [Microbacterium oxydans]|uniref:hypothetical protein n=1 Tax=Microbacterium oxydans TaxID=82380 RepID=UPI000F8F90F6|nr:hypothetical protein [Microbacterium oxydans]AZS48890.1 hypothetical protein CVS53_03613 [Microbacterium oxydans]